MQTTETVSPPPPSTPSTTGTAPAESATSSTAWTFEFDWSKAVDYGVRIAGVILLLAVAWILASWTRRLIRQAFTRTGTDPTLGKFVSNLARWAILVLAVLACLGTVGVQTTSFAAVVGAAGLAIGLALQGSLSHLAAGVMLLVFRPFRVGDGVVVGGQTGLVNEIDLFTTTIDTPDGRRVIIPNGQIFGNVIENLTYHPRRRIDLTVNVAPASDPDRVRTALIAAAHATPGVLADPAPDAAQTDLAGGWMLMAWVNTPEFLVIRQSLMKAVRESLMRDRIDPARPLMDIHVKSMVESAMPALRG